MSQPAPPQVRRRDHILREAARGVGTVVVLALLIVAAGVLLAVTVSWLA